MVMPTNGSDPSTRLKRAGKRPKVVLTACMRKLLVILNTMVRNQTNWKTTVIPQNS
jgi:transposase